MSDDAGSSRARSAASARGPARRSSARAPSVVAFDLGDDLARLRLIASPQEIDGIDFVRGDITDLASVEAASRHGSPTSSTSRRSRCRSAASDPVRRRAGERDRHGERLRGGEAARARTPIAYASSAAVYDDGTRRGRADDALRRLQAGERGHARIYADERRRQHRAAAVHRLRPGPRPGPDRGADARDRGGGSAASRTGSVRRPDAAPLRAATWPAPSSRRRARRPQARRRTASAARRPRSPTSPPCVERELPGAEVTVDETPLPFPPELPSRGSTRRSHRSRTASARRSRSSAAPPSRAAHALPDPQPPPWVGKPLTPTGEATRGTRTAWTHASVPIVCRSAHRA